MVTEVRSGESYELFRACPAIPLAQDGARLEPSDMPVGMQVVVNGEQGDRLVVESLGSTPSQRWRYLVRRADFERAVTPPDTLPRDGQAPTSSSNTSGSPD